MTYTIIGAGLSGLFAAAILREECSLVLEAQPEIPNNHSALLRFRSSIVGDSLNIPFTSVDVIKSARSLGNPVADAISYSIKTNGHATLRSITNSSGRIEKRFIAPQDFIERLARKVTAPFRFKSQWTGGDGPIISTIPMPMLMRLLNYSDIPEFKSVNGYTCTVDLKNTNVCATIYIPDREELPYRASITGSKLIIEYAFPYGDNLELNFIMDDKERALRHAIDISLMFGLDGRFVIPWPVFNEQKYAKILPIDDHARKRFILWASEKHNIYSFGRFATWRPSLLMDDLVNDLRVIQRLAGGESAYNAVK